MKRQAITELLRNWYAKLFGICMSRDATNILFCTISETAATLFLNLTLLLKKKVKLLGKSPTAAGISVLPAFGKQGIGSALINHTINLAQKMGFSAICIYGDPRYYSRFGFRCAEKYEIKTADDKFAVALQVLELRQGVSDNKPGRFIESAAFEVDENEFAKYEATFPFKEKAETDSQREFRFLASLRY